ncbi:MAG TPA: DUF3857 domain-containing protein [Puia sp.]|nr:DUF3857 domain-containing protein [Puia sp.]
MKKSLFLFCMQCSFHFLVAQKDIPEFGKVDMSELTMKECAFEKNANAMNLVQSVKIEFETVIRSAVPETTLEYRYRIKIFNERGFSAANIKIPYFSESKSSKIKDIEGYIYNLDATGNIVKEKLEKKEISKEKSNSKKSFNSVSFTFKNLQNGSVIEYRYKRSNKYSYSIKPWFFQDELPTAISSVTLAIPTYMGMNYHFVTFNPFESDSSFKKNGGGFYDEEIREFIMRNIPSFRIEPYMSSLRDNLQRVEFAVTQGGRYRKLFKDNNLEWSEYNSILLGSDFFGKQFNKSLDSTVHFIDSVKLIMNNEAKIAAVYAFVKKNIKWNNEFTFYCDSLEECWKNKSGSSAEMNILLLNLLRKININSFPILVSTSDNGKTDETFPSLSQFNSVDVVVADSNSVYIMDCTQRGTSFKIPPLNILYSKAFIIDPDRSKWIYITDTRMPMESKANINLIMDSGGIVSGESRFSLIGYAKSATFAEDKKNKKDNGVDKDFAGNVELLSVDTVFDERNDENDDTLIQRMRFHFTPSNTGASYFLNPFLFSYFKKNPFRDTSRLSDIDFGCRQSYFMSIHLKTPDNFLIEDFPKRTAIRMQDSSIMFRREVFQENNEILIRATFTLNDSYFTKENYAAVKMFFDKIYALINEEILLKKKD